MSQHPPHGTLPHVTYSIVCEGTCGGTRIDPPMPPVLDSASERQFARAWAEQNGWYVALDRGDSARSRDLCPQCKPRGK